VEQVALAPQAPPSLAAGEEASPALGVAPRPPPQRGAAEPAGNRQRAVAAAAVQGEIGQQAHLFWGARGSGGAKLGRFEGLFPLLVGS
jgi:hypothetical protein